MRPHAPPRQGSGSRNRNTSVILALLLTPAAPAAAQLPAILDGIELPAPVRMQNRLPASQAACNRRPRLLTPMLYVHAGLQAADWHTTRKAMRVGAREMNPLMKWAADSDWRLGAIKAAATTTVIWSTNRYACRHPDRALALLIAINVIYGAVATHNQRAHARMAGYAP